MGTAVAHVEDRSEGFDLPAPDVRTLARRAVIPAGIALVAAAAIVAMSGPLQAFAGAFERALSADPRWVVAAGAFELLSFGGYIALLWLVGGRATPRIGPRESAQITLGGTAASRLLPTAGVGGAALTLWALRRSGLDMRTATRTLLAFLVVLYSVFLISVAASGALLVSGVVANDAPLALSAVPAAAAALITALGLAIGARRLAPARAPASRWAFRARSAAALVGTAVRDALALVRSGDPRLLGAVAWWAFDAAVLWAMFNAFGAPPALAVLVLAYFVGQVGNTLPIPGAVSGGIVGVLIAFGVEADLALASVLAYRAVAIWMPAPVGLAVLGGLRRTLASWKREDAADAPADLPITADVPVRAAA
jgi:uncharacterized membrane protein YbhN (UPF0104 family)